MKHLFSILCCALSANVVAMHERAQISQNLRTSSLSLQSSGSSWHSELSLSEEGSRQPRKEDPSTPETASLLRRRSSDEERVESLSQAESAPAVRRRQASCSPHSMLWTQCDQCWSPLFDLVKRVQGPNQQQQKLKRLKALLVTGKLAVDFMNADGSTPLMEAVAVGNCEAAEALLAAGANPDAYVHYANPYQPEGEFKIDWVISPQTKNFGDKKLCCALAKPCKKLSPMLIAVLRNNPRMIRILSGYSNLSHGRTCNGVPLALLACQKKQWDALYEIVRLYGICPPDFKGETLLDVALDAPDYVMHFLLGHASRKQVRALVEERYRGGRNSLFYGFDSLLRMKDLVAIGCDPDRTTIKGKTLFMEAVMNRAPTSVLAYILSVSSCGVNDRDKLKRTALMLAAREGNIDGATFLLDQGADVFAKDKDGDNVLNYIDDQDREMWGLLASFVKYIEAIKSVGSNTCDEDGRSVLIREVIHGDSAIVRWLLKNGALINVRDENGKTALDYAVEAGNQNESLIQLLLDHNARFGDDD